MNSEPTSYVSSVMLCYAHVICLDKTLDSQLKALGGKSGFLKRNRWQFRYSDESNLASILAALRDLGFAFMGGPGWSPAAVFEDLREKGLLSGSYHEIVWVGPNKTVNSER